MTMTNAAWPRRLALSVTLFSPILLSACASDQAPRSFAKPDFGYLPKIHLNVATVDIDDSNPPVRDNRDMAILAPNRPADELRQMARQRLLPDGTQGRAVFHVNEASVVPDHDKLRGALAVQLEVGTSDGSKMGYAEARVERTVDYDNDGPNATRATLDNLINQLMNDMNVEFEFQVRRSLKMYLATGAAAQAPIVARPVQTETLAPFLTPTPVPPKP